MAKKTKKNDEFKVFETTCPYCGGEDCIDVVSGCFAAKGVRLQKDGFDMSEARRMDTEDEMVLCNKCEKLFSIVEMLTED